MPTQLSRWCAARNDYGDTRWAQRWDATSDHPRTTDLELVQRRLGRVVQLCEQWHEVGQRLAGARLRLNDAVLPRPQRLCRRSLHGYLQYERAISSLSFSLETQRPWRIKAWMPYHTPSFLNL